MTPEEREEDARQLMERVRAALAKHAPEIEAESSDAKAQEMPPGRLSGRRSLR